MKIMSDSDSNAADGAGRTRPLWREPTFAVADTPGIRSTLVGVVSGRDIIVIGTSAGGLQALITLAGGLRAALPAAIFVVMHTWADHEGALPKNRAKAGPLPAVHARQGETIRHHCIHVAPPDYHLLVHWGCTRPSGAPRENHFRPAVDPLFGSASRGYGLAASGS